MVNCPGDSLQAAVNVAQPGDIIKVTGTCNENVLVPHEKHKIVIDGQNVATIHGQNSAAPTLNVRGKGIVIQNFEITGGNAGIDVNLNSMAEILHNNIHNTGGDGIVINQSSSGVIMNNNIHNNPDSGIAVTENSTARIGFSSTTDSSPGPNIIQSNGNSGIVVIRTSQASIVANTITDNARGIGVFRLSQADIASNIINDNRLNGITVSQNSGIQLGEDSPVSFFDQPNITTVNNDGFGIACSMGSYVRGHLGSSNQLNGDRGQTSIDATCSSNLVTP
jgi:hypothetical protein